jgi:hypothetical protein
MKKLSCALFALLPLATFAAYQIDVESELNGAEVSYSTQEISGDMAAIFLVNQGRTDARCTAVFRNGPESPRTRKVTLKSGQEASLTSKFTRDILRLRIKLECHVD